MIKDGLKPILTSIGKNNYSSNFNFKVGRVYATILNENNPSPYIFEKYGGWEGLGTVLYLDYEQGKNISSQQVNLSECLSAKPLLSNQKVYPLAGELVLLFDLPNNISQVTNTSSQRYYLSTINIWNNIQHNAQIVDNVLVLGKTFNEKKNINSIQPYEGDVITEGRNGNSIRLSSTSKETTRPNNWSSVGNEGDPITIISNGLNFDLNSLAPYIEDINKDKSSLYLTSTQSLPISISQTLNPITKPILPNKYNRSQFVGVGDRIVLSSKTDDILAFGKTNIELYSGDSVSLNSKKRIIFDSSKIYLGLKTDSDGLPNMDEAVLLGTSTIKMLANMITSLAEFSNELSSAISTPEGTPITGIQTAAVSLTEKLKDNLNELNNLLSDTVFIKK